MHDGKKDLTLLLFSNESGFQPRAYMNSQNNRFPTLTNQVPLHAVKVAMRVTRFIGPIFS